MSVIIGVDPHKATHTGVAIDRTEVEVSRARVRSTRKQVQQLLACATPFGRRTWAIESAVDAKPQVMRWARRDSNPRLLPCKNPAPGDLRPTRPQIGTQQDATNQR
jgi:hypothetical protein